MSNASPRPRAIVFGIAGTRLTAAERDLFRVSQPLGFILFGRNCESPDQLRDLVSSLRDSVGRDDAPVLIDQEGGRVVRLREPHWRANPAAARFGDLALQSLDQAVEAARLNARLCAAELYAAGIDVNCAPTLDLHRPETTRAIGNRAYAGDPGLVVALGQAVIAGHLAGGVLPVIKHIPGHGRATVDSHHELPVVKAEHAELSRTDFRPFVALASNPIGMTCHLLFQGIDPNNPATQSRRIIAEVIRGEIGFDGLLLSDDISMQALGGNIVSRTIKALEAGCDAVLHCTGLLDEMSALGDSVPPMSDKATARFSKALAHKTQPDDIDEAALEARLAALLGA